MIEKVRRIILDAMEVCTLPKCPDERATCEACAIDRICQLLPEGDDEGLLTVEAVASIIHRCKGTVKEARIEAAREQRDLTRRECQERVERIFREIENSLRITTVRDRGSGDFYVEISRGTMPLHEWQALKEEVK